MDAQQHTRTMAALNRLCKWRSLFAGWQLGTRSKQDPECAAVRDHREATLNLKATTDAIVAVLVDKGLVTADEFLVAVEESAELMNRQLEQRFPGVTATDHGLTIDQRAQEWMRPPNWPM